MTTLEAVLGRRPSFDETQASLAEGFRRVHGVVLRPEGLTGEETRHMDALVRDKYGAEEWTRAGRVVAHAPRPEPRGATR
jgi:lipoate-protein ligase A